MNKNGLTGLNPDGEDLPGCVKALDELGRLLIGFVIFALSFCCVIVAVMGLFSK